MNKLDKIELRITPDLKDQVKASAKNEGLTMSAWLTRLITLNIKDVKKENT